MFSRPVWILFAGTLINRTGTFVVVFLVIYLARLGHSSAEAGLAVGLYGVGALLASWIGGELADRLGRRPSIAISMFGGAVALVALGQAQSLPAILAWSLATGFLAELYRPAASALLADLTPAAERVTVFAWYRMAINLGAAIGPVLGGVLASRSFQWLFWGDALGCVLYGVIAMVALPPSPRPPSPVPALAPKAGAVWRDREFGTFLLASVLSATVYAQCRSAFALEIGARGWSDTVYGALVGLNGLVVLLLELPIAAVTRHLPRRPVIALGYLLVGVGFALTGVASGVWLLGATVVIWTLGEIIASPVSAAYVSELAPPHLAGRYQGAWGTTFALGFIVGPVLGGWLHARSPVTLWWVLLGLGVISALLLRGRPAPRS